MKKLKVICLIAVLAAQMLSGCGGGGSKPYQIIDRMSGPAQITLYVEAPVGASQSEMETWAKEIEASEGDGSRSVMINFYNGGRGAQNMIASYQGGTLYKTR